MILDIGQLYSTTGVNLLKWYEIVGPKQVSQSRHFILLGPYIQMSGAFSVCIKL